MILRLLGPALLAFALAAPVARADDDVIRLKLPGMDDAPATRLGVTDEDLEAEDMQLSFRRGGVWVGGFRGYYGGFRGGYVGWRGGWGAPGYWGGYRGFYGGAFAPRFAYWPRYYGFGPRVWGVYSPWIGYGVPVASYSYYVPAYTYSYYDPCAIASVATIAPVRTLEIRPTVVIRPSTNGSSAPPPMPRADDGMYDYNGGPTSPIPMPRGEESMGLPRVPTPLTDRLVSIKPEPTTGKYIYPAYGELPRRSGR